MIKEIIASSLLAINIGIQNTRQETTNYLNWQPTNAQKINIDADNTAYYRYIKPTKTFKTDIIEIKQNAYYNFQWRLAGNGTGVAEGLYIVTEIIPDETIDGTYTTYINNTLNYSYYNMASPYIDVATYQYVTIYNNLTLQQKANLTEILENDNWQTINYNDWNTTTQNIQSIANAGTLIDDTDTNQANLNILNQSLKITSYTGNFDDGRIIVIDHYLIDFKSLYTNADIQDINNVFDTAMFIPETTIINMEWNPPAQTGEIVDIPGIMFTMLGMPFAFVAQAFDLTIFPNTNYEINLSQIFLAIAAAGILLFIIKKVIK